jgi:hypothetical protein
MKPQKPTTPPNMAKEYRKELRGLEKTLRSIVREYKTTTRRYDLAIARLLKCQERELKGLDSAAQRIEHRKSILLGRLS